ncbi:unnamed protein product [Adineta steineri]|uniref:Uncharacterized protein n=1 Tax=Adineta steineri TaxID=433720 RepID=A0A814U847_9BILA|nr:unnamed protein product [Adineta steineri]CAF1171696.1 unnamed protein product [Adineta steineri]CAF1173011.1 unnamed protein product [Adineta steineri]
MICCLSVIFISLLLLIVQCEDYERKYFNRNFPATTNRPEPLRLLNQLRNSAVILNRSIQAHDDYDPWKYFNRNFWTTTNRPKLFGSHTFKHSMSNWQIPSDIFLNKTDTKYPPINFNYPSIYQDKSYQELIKRLNTKSCLAAQKTCGIKPDEWCCSLNSRCGINHDCFKYTTTNSQPTSTGQIRFVIFIVSVLIYCCCQIFVKSKKQYNPVTGISTFTVPQQSSIPQADHIPMNFMVTRENIMSLNLRDLDTQSTNSEILREHDRRTGLDTIIIMSFEQQPSTPPPAYDELSLHHSMAIEQQSLLPPTYADFIQSTNESERTI